MSDGIRQRVNDAMPVADAGAGFTSKSSDGKISHTAHPLGAPKHSSIKQYLLMTGLVCFFLSTSVVYVLFNYCHPKLLLTSAAFSQHNSLVLHYTWWTKASTMHGWRWLKNCLASLSTLSRNGSLLRQFELVETRLYEDSSNWPRMVGCRLTSPNVWFCWQIIRFVSCGSLWSDNNNSR